MPSTTRTLKVTAGLPDGRLLIAHLDPRQPEKHSPLRRALHAAGIPLTNRDQ
ncbi:hypothetical protein [Streptomyces lavendulocolor]|uniref:hypothetical protein n=1 Tax=Streptomyces lavendulocolor TaxID=67316 RepID=UPI003C2FEF2E